MPLADVQHAGQRQGLTLRANSTSINRYLAGSLLFLSGVDGSWIATPLTLSICLRRSVVEAVVWIVHGVAAALRVAAISLAQVVDVAVDEVALVALEAGSRLPIHSSENVVVFPDPVVAADIV